jgi:hypothetical protein
MATQTIDYNINVNAGGSLRTIQDIENELNELNQEIKDVGVNSDAFNKAAGNIQKLESELKGAQAGVEGFTLDKKLETADGAIKVVAGSVAALTGGLGLLGIENENFEKLTAQATNAIAFGMGIKDLSEGFGKLAKNLNVAGIAQKAYNLVQRAFNAILAANPIGLTILAITTLIALVVGLKDKFEAVNKVFQFFKGLVTAVGQALGLAATEEEKAAQAAKEASEQRVKDIDNELKIRKAAGDETVALEREKQALLTSLTEEGSQERMDAEANAAAFEAQLIKAAEDRAKAASSRRRSRRKAQREKEKAEEEAAAQKIIDDALAEEKRLADGLQAFRDNFKKEKEDAAVENEVERLELELIRREKELEELNLEESEKAALKLFYANKIAEAQLEIDTTAAADAEELRLKKKEIDDQELADKELIEKQKLMVVGDTFGAIAGILGEASVAGKAFATGQALINTYLGVTEVLGTESVLPEPFATISRIASIATVLATGFKTIKSINSVQPMAAGGGTPSLNVSAGQASAAPPTSSPNFDIGVSPETQVGTNSVQAYVVSGDITSSQEAEAKLSTRRAIGG